MIVKFGSIVTAGKGKVGGHVFQSGRTSSVMKKKQSGKLNSSVNQTKRRVWFTAVTQAWRDLTSGQREAWNNNAKDFRFKNAFGEYYTPTGQQLYTSCNINRRMCGQSSISAAPSNVAVTPITAFTIDTIIGGSDTLYMFLTGIATLDADQYFKVLVSPSMSPGVSNPRNQYRFAVAASQSLATFEVEYENLQSAIKNWIPGQIVFVKLVPVNLATGIEGSGVVNTATVAAP